LPLLHWERVFQLVEMKIILPPQQIAILRVPQDKFLRRRSGQASRIPTWSYPNNSLPVTITTKTKENHPGYPNANLWSIEIGIAVSSDIAGQQSRLVSSKAFEAVFFSFTDRTDFRWTIPRAQVSADAAPPNRQGKSRTG